jgi:hypothetical protein
LIIAARGVKPAFAMKTLSVRFRFVVLGIIAIVVVGCCCYFPSITDTIPRASVEIGHDVRGKRTYVKWKDDGVKFKQALEQVRGHNGEYCICVLEKPGDKPYQYPYSKCPGHYTCPPENNPPGNIRTVKVTKSKAADNIAAGESAVNDPHATYRVQSADPGDISKVLDALEH